ARESPELDQLIGRGDCWLGCELRLPVGLESTISLDDFLSADDLIALTEMLTHQLVSLLEVVRLAKWGILRNSDHPEFAVLVHVPSRRRGGAARCGQEQNCDPFTKISRPHLDRLRPSTPFRGPARRRKVSGPECSRCGSKCLRARAPVAWSACVSK